MSQKSNIYVSRNLRSIAILTLITSILWTAFNIYHASIQATSSSVSADTLKPIDSSLDTETLNTLSSRRQLANDPDIQATLQQALDKMAASKTEKASINQVTPATTPTATASAKPAL